MRRSGLIAGTIGTYCLLVLSAVAQSPTAQGPTATESVTVTAPSLPPEAAVQAFVKSLAASPEPIGKIARWRTGICPAVAGISTDYGKFVSQRLKEIAAQVGAPVGKQSCKANIDIVFTPAPQVLMDNVRQKHAVLLGYHDTAQAESLATVSHPVQAWYTTETEDYDGYRTIDSAQRNRGVTLFEPPGPGCRTGCTIFLPNAREEHTDTSRLTDTLRSELFHVIITVDLKRIAGVQLGALSDYIALLALVPARSFDNCQNLVSIANLIATGCGGNKKPDALSAYDLAYLHAVYQMDSSASLAQQRSTISYWMLQQIKMR